MTPLKVIAPDQKKLSLLIFKYKGDVPDDIYKHLELFIHEPQVAHIEVEDIHGFSYYNIFNVPKLHVSLNPHTYIKKIIPLGCSIVMSDIVRTSYRPFYPVLPTDRRLVIEDLGASLYDDDGLTWSSYSN